MKATQGASASRSASPARMSPATQRRMLYAVLVFLLLLATFLVNVVANRLGERWLLTVDLTANAAYRLGSETRSLLQGLDRDVRIYVLAAQDSFGGSPYLAQAQRIIDQYPRFTPRVSLTYVDYVFDPTFASRYPDLTLAEGNVLVESGGRIKQILLSELFNYTSDDMGRLSISSSRAEEAVTSAILYVTSDRPLRVALLTGNGVADEPAFTKLLTDNNYEVSPVSLALDPLDDSYVMALLLAPQTDLSEQVLDKLDAFLYNNGAYGKTLLYTSAVTQGALPNLETYLKEWGIVVGDGAVFETTATRTYRYQPYYPAAEYVNEAYRNRLKDAASPVLMPLARPLEVLWTARDTYRNDVLLQFSETSGVRPSSAVESFSAEQAERWGPLPALVLASRQIYGTTGTVQFRSNLLVSASTAMLDEFSLQNSSLSNSDYMVKLLNDLCDRPDAVSFEPKSLAGQVLAVNTAQARVLGIVLAVLLPLAILGAGLAIWLVRRYQ